MSDSIESCSSCGKPLIVEAGHCASCRHDVVSSAAPTGVPARSRVVRALSIRTRSAGRPRRQSVLAGLGAAAVLVVLIGAIAWGMVGGSTNATPAPSRQVAALATPTIPPTESPTAAPTAKPTKTPKATPEPTDDEGGGGCGDAGTRALAFAGRANAATRFSAWAAPAAPATSAISPATGIPAGHFVRAGALIADGGYDTATLLPSGKVLFVGGDDGGGKAELYDPATNRFTFTGSIGNAAAARAVLLPSGKVLVDATTSPPTVGCAGWSEDELLQYDPASAKFSLLVGASSWPIHSIGLGLNYDTMTLLANGKVLFAEGNASGEEDGGAQLYDPATNKFAPTGPMSQGRSGAAATLLPDGTVLFAGGMGYVVDVSLNTAELYRPDHNDFVPVSGSMTVGRTNSSYPGGELSATLVANGRVLIAGGDSGSELLSSAELYDPKTHTFSATGSMTVVRYVHAATLLRDARVLITGGAGASAELYDPAEGRFTATAGDMTQARDDTAQVLLPNGLVLVVGNGTADLYQP